MLVNDIRGTRAACVFYDDTKWTKEINRQNPPNSEPVYTNRVVGESGACKNQINANDDWDDEHKGGGDSADLVRNNT